MDAGGSCEQDLGMSTSGSIGPDLSTVINLISIRPPHRHFIDNEDDMMMLVEYIEAIERAGKERHPAAGSHR